MPRQPPPLSGITVGVGVGVNVRVAVGVSVGVGVGISVGAGVIVGVAVFIKDEESWIIDELKSVGCDTAKSVLDISEEDLIKRSDLEEETVDTLLSTLQKEFE